MNNEQKEASKQEDQGSPVNLSSSVESGLRTGTPSVLDPLLVAEKVCCPVEGAGPLSKALGETKSSKPSAVGIWVQSAFSGRLANTIDNEIASYGPFKSLPISEDARWGRIVQVGGPASAAPWSRDFRGPGQIFGLQRIVPTQSIGLALPPEMPCDPNTAPAKPPCFSCRNGSRQCLNMHKQCSSVPIDALRNANRFEATVGWLERKELEFCDLSECNGSRPCSNEERPPTIVPNNASTRANGQFVVRMAENDASMFESSDTGPGPAALGISGADDVLNSETFANASDNVQIVVNHKEAAIGRPNESFVSIYDLVKRNRRFVNPKMRSNAAMRTSTHDDDENNSATSPGDLRSGFCETNATWCPSADIILRKQVSHANSCNDMPIANDSLAPPDTMREVLGTAVPITSVGSLFDNSTHLGQPTESAMVAQLRNELNRVKQQCFANELQYNNDLKNCNAFWHERVQLLLTSEQQRVHERVLAEKQRCQKELELWLSSTMFHIDRANVLEKQCIALSEENEVLRSNLALFSASPASSMQSSSRKKADESRSGSCVASRAPSRKMRSSASSDSSVDVASLNSSHEQSRHRSCRKAATMSSGENADAFNRTASEQSRFAYACSSASSALENESGHLGSSKWQQHEGCSYLTPPLSWSTTSEKKVCSNRTLRRRKARKQRVLHARIAPKPPLTGEYTSDSFSERQSDDSSSSVVLNRANVRMCSCAPHDERCQRNSGLREPYRSDALPSAAMPRKAQRMAAARGPDEHSVVLASSGLGSAPRQRCLTQSELPLNDLMATMPFIERLGYVRELPPQLRHEPADFDANNSKLQRKHHETISSSGLDFTRSAADSVCFAKVKDSGQSLDIPPAGEQNEEPLPGSENEEGEPEPGQPEASAHGPTAHAHDSDSASGDEADDIRDDLEVPTTQHYLVAPDIQQPPPNLNNVVCKERYTATVKIRIKHQETWVIINPSSSVSLVSEEYLRTHQRRDSIVRYPPRVTGIRGACPEALAVTACVSLRVSIPGIRSFHFDFHAIPSRHRVIIGEDLLQHRYLGLSRSVKCSYTLGTLSIGNSADMRMLRRRFYELSSRDRVPLPSVGSREPEVRAEDSLASTSGLPPTVSTSAPDTVTNDSNRQEVSMQID